MKKGSKSGLLKTFEPILVPGIHDPRISRLPSGTKNQKMRGPPLFLVCTGSPNSSLYVLNSLCDLDFEPWVN
jgi:hypothetical protein